MALNKSDALSTCYFEEWVLSIIEEKLETETQFSANLDIFE